MKKFLILAFVTHYIYPGVMSDGTYTHLGAIACPREFKLQTKVEIEGKTYTCADRTNKKYNGRFDIFTTESKPQALQFGKQLKEVTIYGN